MSTINAAVLFEAAAEYEKDDLASPKDITKFKSMIGQILFFGHDNSSVPARHIMIPYKRKRKVQTWKAGYQFLECPSTTKKRNASKDIEGVTSVRIVAAPNTRCYATRLPPSMRDVELFHSYK